MYNTYVLKKDATLAMLSSLLQAASGVRTKVLEVENGKPREVGSADSSGLVPGFDSERNTDGNFDADGKSALPLLDTDFDSHKARDSRLETGENPQSTPQSTSSKNSLFLEYSSSDSDAVTDVHSGSRKIHRRAGGIAPSTKSRPIVPTEVTASDSDSVERAPASVALDVQQTAQRTMPKFTIATSFDPLTGSPIHGRSPSVEGRKYLSELADTPKAFSESHRTAAESTARLVPYKQTKASGPLTPVVPPSPIVAMGLKVKTSLPPLYYLCTTTVLQL